MFVFYSREPPTPLHIHFHGTFLTPRLPYQCVVNVIYSLTNEYPTLLVASKSNEYLSNEYVWEVKDSNLTFRQIFTNNAVFFSPPQYHYVPSNLTIQQL